MIRENNTEIIAWTVASMTVAFIVLCYICFIAWRSSRKYTKMDAYERLEILEMEVSFDESERVDC